MNFECHRCCDHQFLCIALTASCYFNLYLDESAQFVEQSCNAFLLKRYSVWNVVMENIWCSFIYLSSFISIATGPAPPFQVGSGRQIFTKLLCRFGASG